MAGIITPIGGENVSRVIYHYFFFALSINKYHKGPEMNALHLPELHFEAATHVHNFKWNTQNLIEISFQSFWMKRVDFYEKSLQN